MSSLTYHDSVILHNAVYISAAEGFQQHTDNQQALSPFYQRPPRSFHFDKQDSHHTRKLATKVTTRHEDQDRHLGPSHASTPKPQLFSDHTHQRSKSFSSTMCSVGFIRYRPCGHCQTDVDTFRPCRFRGTQHCTGLFRYWVRDQWSAWCWNPECADDYPRRYRDGSR